MTAWKGLHAMDKNLLAKVKDHLVQRYHCHAIILYGSFAEGSYTPQSDIDLICFCDRVSAQNDTSFIDGRQLDAWIYETEMMKNYEKFLHIEDGKILLDERNLCDKLLKSIRGHLNDDANKPAAEEIAFQKAWLKKMLDRSKKSDVEGNFRYHWMLSDSLEIYFAVRGIRYKGPKKALSWMKDLDSDAFELFSQALKTNAHFEAAEELINFIIELGS